MHIDSGLSGIAAEFWNLFSLAGLIAFSLRPQLAQKVKLFMTLAPIYTFVGTSGPATLFCNLPDGLMKVGISHRFL